MENKLTLKSGSILISLSSSVTGGVVYARKDLDKRCAKPGKDSMGGDAACKLLEGHGGKCDFTELTAEEVTRWETTRTIADKIEHDKAVKVRNKARSLITGVCASSNFGQLCLASHEAELDARYLEAKAMIEEFNGGSNYTRVSLYMLKGVIPDNTSSAESISSEVVELIDQMISGISSNDEEMIREAAGKLTQLVEILDDSSKAMAERAIAEARSAARALVKAAKGEGQSIAEQKRTDKSQQAEKTLKATRKALDMNADVFAQIEAATKGRKAG